MKKNPRACLGGLVSSGSLFLYGEGYSKYISVAIVPPFHVLSGVDKKSICLLVKTWFGE